MWLIYWTRRTQTLKKHFKLLNIAALQKSVADYLLNCIYYVFIIFVNFLFIIISYVFNMLAPPPHFGTHSWKWPTKPKIITVADFSVLHTQFWCLCKEDPLGFSIHQPELIKIKNIKGYRDRSALKKCVPHWMVFYLYFIFSHKNTLNKSSSNPEK